MPRSLLDIPRQVLTAMSLDDVQTLLGQLKRTRRRVIRFELNGEACPLPRGLSIEAVEYQLARRTLSDPLDGINVPE